MQLEDYHEVEVLQAGQKRRYCLAGFLNEASHHVLGSTASDRPCHLHTTGSSVVPMWKATVVGQVLATCRCTKARGLCSIKDIVGAGPSPIQAVSTPRGHGSVI